MAKAIYPGTFDPITYGHLDVIQRGSAIFEELVVAVARNPEKEPIFTVQERVEMLKELTKDLPNVTVETFEGMTVDYVRRCGARVILRGIRTVSDFEYEFQLALTNRALADDIETVFVMTKQEYSYIRGTTVKEIVQLGGEVRSFVPPEVEVRLREKLGVSRP